MAFGDQGQLTDVYRQQPQQQNNDPVLYASEAIIPMPQSDKTPSPSKAEIEAYIKEVFGIHASQALAVFTCESGLNPYAYNPETISKEKGITQFSSCGIAQINGSECNANKSILYDFRRNVDRAFQLYLHRGWSPWSTCKTKLGL